MLPLEDASETGIGKSRKAFASLALVLRAQMMKQSKEQFIKSLMNEIAQVRSKVFISMNRLFGMENNHGRHPGVSPAEANRT